MRRHVLVDQGSEQLEATSAEKVVQLLSPDPVAFDLGGDGETSPAVLAGGALIALGAAYALYASSGAQ